MKKEQQNGKYLDMYKRLLPWSFKKVLPVFIIIYICVCIHIYIKYREYRIVTLEILFIEIRPWKM